MNPLFIYFIRLHKHTLMEIYHLMSKANIYGLDIIYPSLDVYIGISDNYKFCLSDSYLKYFVLFSCVLGIIKVYNLLGSLLRYFRRNVLLRFFLNRVLPSKSDEWACIVGYGDNEASVSLAKYYSKRGYNLLLLSNTRVKALRKTYDLNKIQEVPSRSDIKMYEFSYEEFIEKCYFAELDSNAKENELEASAFDTMKIKFVFDCSVLRLYNEDLNKEDKAKHLESFFFNNAVCDSTKVFMDVFDQLKRFYCKSFTFFIFDYPDKGDEMNHKLFYSFRLGLFSRYREIFNERARFFRVRFLNEFNGRYLTKLQARILEEESEFDFDSNGCTKEFNFL